jgi:hypothetical protein
MRKVPAVIGLPLLGPVYAIDEIDKQPFLVRILPGPRAPRNNRRWGEKESDYKFPSPDKLLADFQSDIERWNYENGHS